MASQIIEWLQTIIVALLMVVMFNSALNAVLVVEHRRLMERLNELPEPTRKRALAAAVWAPGPWLRFLMRLVRR